MILLKNFICTNEYKDLWHFFSETIINACFIFMHDEYELPHKWLIKQYLLNFDSSNKLDGFYMLKRDSAGYFCKEDSYLHYAPKDSIYLYMSGLVIKFYCPSHCILLTASIGNTSIEPTPIYILLERETGNLRDALHKIIKKYDENIHRVNEHIHRVNKQKDTILLYLKDAAAV